MLNDRAHFPVQCPHLCARQTVLGRIPYHRNRTGDKVPVDLACELRQLVPHLDDLVQPGTDHAILSSRAASASLLPPNATTEARHAIRGNPENESGAQTLKPCNLKTANRLKTTLAQ